MSFQVKLKKVEKSARDKGAQDKTAPALNDSLQWYYKPHRGGRGGFTGFGFWGRMVSGHMKKWSPEKAGTPRVVRPIWLSSVYGRRLDGCGWLW